MRVLRRLARLIWGDDVDEALRPVLGVTLVGTAAGSATWSFLAIWAVEELGAKAALPFAFLVGAVFSGLSGFAGGYLSDRIGRRRVILIGNGIMVGYPLLLLALSDAKWAGLAALSLAGVFGSLGGSVSQAMVADLVAPERRQPAYASVRVAANMGVVVGPPLGGLLLVLGSWSALFPCVAVLSGIAWFVAYRYLPHRGEFAPEGPPERGSLSVILGDRRFLIFLGSAVFAWLTYVAYEVVLPVSLVDGYGYQPSAWGFLVWVNPLLVTLLQSRLTRETARVAPAPKLVVALLIMGLPFSLLVLTHALWAIVFVVVVFVIGEMLWVPTSQAVVANLAPPDIRGAYMGAFGSAPAIGFALAPLIGLQVRNSFGDEATWAMFAVIGVIAAVLGGLALTGIRRPDAARRAPRAA
ncbi:MFS transporter [Gaiella sp.]|jgi:MFS family permease|uniref:MFS transporter n=1 Tax=Gaiella sp. TaxID=2663207 RepID=UPI002BD69C55|nr:MFS transporter [Gaiella sp.]HWO81157.1 MFS transporter [Gaiella sp.]